MITSELIERVKLWWDDPKGWCYTASEALYYAAGGKESGFKPMQASIEVDGQRVSHWWLEDRDGNIIDVTADQFDFPFPYELGRGRGFMTNMKADSRELLNWLEVGLDPVVIG